MNKIVVALGFLVVATAGAQTISWTRQFGTVADDSAAALAAGPDGSIYVAGYTYGSLEGSSAGGQDAFVRKYDANGNVLWTRQFGTAGVDYAYALTAGPGGIYVAGWTTGALEGTNAGEQDAFVRKYDADGNVLWTRQFGTASFDYAEALAAGPDGGIYVAGQTWGPLGGIFFGVIDAFLRKYDPDGNVLWTQQIGTPGDDDSRGVTVGPDGSIYVSGWTTGALEGSNAGGFDAFVRKYDANGNVVWTRQFGTTGNDYAYPLTAGPDGIYVAGYTTGSLDGSNAGSFDAFVRKYDFKGNVLWARQFGTAGDDYANGITAGPDGGIYVAGYTSRALAGSNAGQRDAFVRKYDPNGNVLWTRQFGTAGDDLATALTTGLDGGIYVAGSTNGSLEGSNAGGYDAFVMRITPGPPVITWSNPPDIIFGSALGSGQLNATAKVPGTFFYSPPAGTVLPQGSNTLSVVFTPNDTINYSSASASVVVNVVAGRPQFVVTRTLSRDSNKNIAVAVTVTNTGVNPANLTSGPYLALGMCKLGSASPLAVVGPPAGNTIAVPPGASEHWIVTFPGPTGAPGATMLLSINGNWLLTIGVCPACSSEVGSISYSSRTVLP